jgi:hypothetical protein
MAASRLPGTLHSVERRVAITVPPTLRDTTSSPRAPAALHT